MLSHDKLGDKVIIIPRGESMKKNFEPRFVIMLPGQTVTWINRDTVPHALTSGESDGLISGKIFNTGLIPAGESDRVTIRSNIGIIPYFCSVHPSERGTIVVISKDENLLSNAERLELLDSVFTFGDTSERDAVRSASERHFHPNTLSKIADPDLVKIHNKILTIVFWDLSGFSALCEKIKEHPVLVVEFLKEYYTKATEIIHKYNGVLDKFIGDGVMAFFGFQSRGDDHVSKYAIDAINAAIELKDSFEKIKTVWLDIWRNKINDYDNVSIDLKCGINTGCAIVGYIPTKERDEFTAIGTHVNLASRLEKKATGNQIIVSSYTKERIQNQFSIKTILIESGEEIKAFEYIHEYYEVIGKVVVV
jgi:class 3 adenylate cyclase/plastocyanin